MPRVKRFSPEPGHTETTVSKDQVPPEQQDWSPGLDQEDPPELHHIKEEQEELWSSQEEADIHKVSRLQDLKDSFRRRLVTAAREELTRHFETTISEYEKEIERQHKLLDVVLQPEVRLHRAEVQQLSTSKDQVPPEQQDWSPGLDQEDPPELHHIKEEQEELWSSQEEADIHKVSRLQDLKDSFRRRLKTAAREELTRHFETTISEYEKEIERQHKLLDVVLQPEVRLHRADVQQLSASKDQVPPEQQDWSPGLDQEEPEPPHIKEEQEELWSSQEEADITKFTFTPVAVKSEDDDEEKPQSSQLHQRQTEAGGEDCGGPGPARNSDPDQLQPDPDDRTEDSSESETKISDDDRKSRDAQSGFSFLKTNRYNYHEQTFHCFEFSKRFKNSRLKIHMRIHSREKPFSCSLCGKRFEQKNSLIYHLKIHTGEKPFSCSVCGKSFSRKPNLWKHVRCHTGEKPYRCSLCQKCFTRFEHLQSHMRFHTGEKPFSCSVCGKSFSRESNLWKHVRCHTGEKPYRCSLCQKYFPQLESLQSHLRTHMGEKPFSCSACGQRFTWCYQLKKHECGGESSQLRGLWTGQEEERRREPQSSQLHQTQTEADAKDCGGPGPARSSDPDNLQPDPDDRTEDSSRPETEHSDTDWKDPDRRSFACSVCSKTFNHKGNLNIHMRTHTGVKPFSCSLCGKGFTQKAGLDYHLKTHTGEKPFSCSLCSKTYRHKGALTYHMATHTGLKPFSCRHCGKTFRGAPQLRIHKCVGDPSQSHRSDKRKKLLSCSECDATFPNNYLLMTHVRMHKGKKLFTCTICGAKRQFSSHLEIHMRTHTGERPYSCSVCGKRFSQRGIVKQHMAIHSGVKPFSCGDCGRRFFWQFQVKKHKCLSKSLQQRRTEINGKNCGESEPIRIFNPFRHLRPVCDKKTQSSGECDGSVDAEFWKETRQHQSGFTYQRSKKVSVSDDQIGNKPFSRSDDRAKTEPRSGDGVNVDLFKQTRQRQSGLNHLKHQNISISDSGFNADRKLIGSSEDSHTLQTHRFHSGGKPYSCSFCQQDFATGALLTRHISIHLGEKLLSCIICEKTFSLKSELMSHECVCESSRLHQSRTVEQITANRPFSCSVCGKGFSRKHHLQTHLRVHAGEKPFSCSICGKTFVRRESLSYHMTCHSGEKPLHCSVCNTGFIDSESLIKHMRIHTRQTQFSCSVCGKEFAWRRYLTKHMDVHRHEKIYRCSDCNRRFTHIYQLNYHQCSGESSKGGREPTADKGDCGGPGPARNSDLDQDRTEDSSESETDHSDEDWKESREPPSGLNSLKHDDLTCDADRKRLSCSETFYNRHLLQIHTRSHADELLNGSVLTGAHEEAKQEADITKFTFTPVPVKSEDDEKPQSSQLHQRQTEAGGEDCGGPGPARNSDPDQVQPDPRPPDSEDSVDSDFWKETRKRPSGLNSIKHEDTKRKQLRCSECGDTFYSRHLLEIHTRNHTGGELLNSSVSGDHCTERGGLSPHMAVHKEAKKEEPEPPHIKEEQEELWSSQEEADITKFTFTLVPVKSEDDDDEEKPQCSQLHQRQTEAGGEDCGGPGPARTSDPDQFQPDSEDSVDSDFWKETRERPTDLNSVKSDDVSESVAGCESGRKVSICPDEASESLELDSDDSDFWTDDRKPHETRRKPYSCSECGRRFLHIHHLKNHMRFHVRQRAPFSCSVCGHQCLYKSLLKIHMRTHTGEKPFVCPVCGKKYAHKASMQSHMVVHTVEKQYTCDTCHRGFAWYTELKYHQCVGQAGPEASDWRETTSN